jgi:hypothetical protein
MTRAVSSLARQESTQNRDRAAAHRARKQRSEICRTVPTINSLAASLERVPIFISSKCCSRGAIPFSSNDFTTCWLTARAFRECRYFERVAPLDVSLFRANTGWRAKHSRVPALLVDNSLRLWLPSLKLVSRFVRHGRARAAMEEAVGADRESNGWQGGRSRALAGEEFRCPQ